MYDTQKPKLYTDKLLGGIKASVGFVSASPSGRYVPNTVLKGDMRDYVKNVARVVAVFRKDKDDEYYRELTYKAKNVDLSELEYPEPFGFLSSLDF